MQRFQSILIVILTGLAVLFGGLYAHEHEHHNLEERYPLLSERIFTERPVDTTVNFDPLRRDIREYLAEIGVPHSFYFEYLPTGTSIRDGDNNQLVGASLMKIPIVMDAYKAVEIGKIRLDQSLIVPAGLVNANDTQYGNRSGLKPGDQIKLSDATKLTLSESDNAAAFTVFSATTSLLPVADQALNNLDIESQTGESDKGPLVYIGARSYSSVLKCLYFSCFLNRDDSQAILQDLVDSTDTHRIRAGVPAEIPVARKIGSFSDITQSDCGIVYVENRNYALCVMLDEDAPKADEHIKQISKMTYQYISQISR